MAFVYNGINTIESFAEYQDVLDTDSRIFETNEGLSDSSVYPTLIKSTDRILNKLQMSDWWKSYKVTTPINPLLIINSRQSDFTSLCVYFALKEYILPMVADFGTQDNAEFNKMQYYTNKCESLFDELMSDGNWYDWNGDSNISSNEIRSSSILPKRVR